MTVFVVVILTVISFCVVAYPFFTRKSQTSESGRSVKLKELESQKDTTYAMLKELEFDLQSGTLSEEDYQDLEDKYKHKAISILKGIDNVADDSSVEDEIEKRVQELRKSKSLLCPQCGEKYREGDVFCSQCGTRLSKG